MSSKHSPETRLLGIILGEVFRLQKRTAGNMCNHSDASIFGLLKGFDRELDEQLTSFGGISESQLALVETVLDEYVLDSDKLAALRGFYDIEGRLRDGGVSRGEAFRIFQYLTLAQRFLEPLEKMNSINSPTECKTFGTDPKET